jgi:hypothetical protein
MGYCASTSIRNVLKDDNFLLGGTVVQNMPERRGSKHGVRLPGDLEHRNDQDQISIGELREMFKNLMASELRQ